jgi:hypothetical protein
METALGQAVETCGYKPNEAHPLKDEEERIKDRSFVLGNRIDANRRNW